MKEELIFVLRRSISKAGKLKFDAVVTQHEKAKADTLRRVETKPRH